ncbi:MAG TPA: hypothetical protein VNA21_13610, partial [Steroidobacteraceae bacterium]|nr:hypothetical protein [Steroidobacteraceae bacterium]
PANIDEQLVIANDPRTAKFAGLFITVVQHRTKEEQSNPRTDYESTFRNGDERADIKIEITPADASSRHPWSPDIIEQPTADASGSS